MSNREKLEKTQTARPAKDSLPLKLVAATMILLGVPAILLLHNSGLMIAGAVLYAGAEISEAVRQR